MKIVKVVGERSTCDRGRTSCVIAKDKQILATGYAGAAAGLPHCDDVGHLFKTTLNDDGSKSEHCVQTVHAEQNAICQAAKRGISIEGATIYLTMTPCRVCAMLLINCGIKRVYCEKKYHAGAESEEMLAKAGVKLEFKSEDLMQYEKQ
jgi:dCMP deaminase